MTMGLPGGHLCSLCSRLEHRTCVLVLLLLVTLLTQLDAEAVTEGDTGYDYRDYNDAYEEDDFDEESVIGVEPNFDVPVVNVTVVAGQTAVLPCHIKNLGKYTVIWQDGHQRTLTYEDRLVIDDWRYSIVRPFVAEWNMQIRDVRWEDQDNYLCTVNTDPPKHKTVHLYVKVPAQIIDELSSDDINVEEGDTVILTCNVTGVPRPEVTWFRRPNAGKDEQKERKECGARMLNHAGSEIGLDMVGEVIMIQNVTRYCDDIYECVANNGVPPAVTRKIRVTVNFKPEILMYNHRISQEIGKETILDCIITAWPLVTNEWQRCNPDCKQIRTGDTNRHSIEPFHDGHTVTLSLRISNIEPEDFGEYRCVAHNPYGTAKASQWLDEIRVEESRKEDPEDDGSVDIHLPGQDTPSSQDTYTTYHKTNKPEPQRPPGNHAYSGDEDKVAPEVSVLNKRISQEVGKVTILECYITAYPQTSNEWIHCNPDCEKVINDPRRRITPYDDSEHTITLSLRIEDIRPEDFGEYRCVASNKMGHAESSTWLDEYEAPPPAHHPKHRNEFGGPLVVPYSPRTNAPASQNTNPNYHNTDKQESRKHYYDDNEYNQILSENKKHAAASGMRGGCPAKNSITYSTVITPSLIMLSLWLPGRT